MAQSVSAPASTPLVTPLYSLHLGSGARMVDFVGWLLPIQYHSILAEHQAVRNAVGLFDLSHMARLVFRGPGALELAQKVTTNDVTKLAPGQAQYSLVCNPEGGIHDDVVLYKLEDEFLMVVNAVNRTKVVACVHDLLGSQGLEVELEDATERLAMIGVQGPHSEAVLQQLGDADLSRLGHYRAIRMGVAGRPAVVARTGYTGEDGFELIVAAEEAEWLWERLVAVREPAGPVPCGLGSRDTLRLEAGMALYGHELDEQTNPYEAGLGRVVHLEKGDFVGREALQRAVAQGPERRVVGFELLEPGVPRQGYPVTWQGRPIGRVTSGILSPSLKKGIGFASVPAPRAHPGEELGIQVREREVPASVAPTPFLPHRTRPRH